MTFSDILNSFGTAELGTVLGIDESHVRTMRARGSIPPEYWTAIVECARDKGLPDLTLDHLLAMRREKFAPKKNEKPSAPAPSTTGTEAA